MKSAVMDILRWRSMSHEELATITAAGAPSVTTHAAANPVNAPHLLLLGKEEPFINNVSLQNVFRRESPHQVQAGSPTFTTAGAVRNSIVTVFDFKNLNPVIQFGDPAGDFVDFTASSQR